MRILITGGLGFIGGRLGQHLQQAGHRVVLGSRRPVRLADRLPQLDLVQTVWNSSDALEDICTEVDVVIQAAGMNAQDCAADAVAALEFNGLATARLLKAAISKAVKRFIYLSTAHVYARPLVGTIAEDTCPRNLHPYATSHRAGEDVVLGANHRNEIEGVVLRISNVFGAPITKEMNCWMLLVNDLCRQAVQTRNLVLRSDGTEQRDFVSMTNVCRVIEHIASREFGMSEPRLLNVGAGKSLSILQMAELIQQRCMVVLSHEPDLERPGAMSNANPLTMHYRTDRLMQLGFQTTIDYETEIDELLAFCQATFS